MTPDECVEHAYKRERDEARAALRTVEQERDEARADVRDLRQQVEASRADSFTLLRVLGERGVLLKERDAARSALATLMQSELLKDAVVEAAKEWRKMNSAIEPALLSPLRKTRELAAAIDALLAKEQA